MTRTQIQDMPLGSEMDRMIEALIGSDDDQTPSRWSTEPLDMWCLIEAMASRGYWWRGSTGCESSKDLSFAIFEPHGEDNGPNRECAFGSDLMEATARAALMVLVTQESPTP